MKHLLLSCAAAAVLCLGQARVHAEPILQLYLEGSTYDPVTESWMLKPAGSSSGAPFRIWALGNVDGPGGKGTIFDVRLSTVYDTSFGDVDISLTPSTTGGFEGFTDPSTPAAPTFIQTVSDGSTPLLGDGRPLPRHGEYGEGRTWQEFGLGDFTLADSPSGNFIDTVPDPGPLGFQINVYEISVSSTANSSLSGLEIHFDLYNSIEAKNHAKFAPFSHDAISQDADATLLPEPSSLLLAGMGALGLVGYGLRCRKKQVVENA